MDIGVSMVLHYAVRVYSWLIIARVLLSFIRLDPYHPVVRFVYEMTEPLLGFIRNRIPPLGMFDLSPLIAIFAVQFLYSVLVTVLRMFGIY